FCKRDKISKDGLLTFFYKTRQDVDDLYQRLQQWTVTIFAENEKYNIYNFFATDPEGRDLEFQTFLHEIDFSWENYR
ncbi:MAG: VOC family protein, partial [Candidatus Heimdallarchaeota archaeon]|nr:VOC family protein [Candidatus Heimdallarchaeota archaeon]